MIERLRDLDARQRTVLGLVSAVVVVVALLLAATALTGDGDDADRLDTAASSSTTSPSSTSSTVAGSSTTTTAASSSTTAAAVTTSTTARRGGTDGATGGGATGGGSGGRSSTTRPPTATTRPTTTTTPASGRSCAGVGGSAASNDLAQRFCAERARSGLPTMVRTAALNAVAQEWADKLAADRKLSHRTSADLRSRTLQACPTCTGAAENVGFAMDTATIWGEWMGSSTHRSNITHGAAGEYGVAVARSADGYLWAVHNFGRYP